MNDRDRLSYTVPQASEATGVSADVIRGAIRGGQIIPRYLTKTLRVIPADELRRWINESPTERQA